MKISYLVKKPVAFFQFLKRLSSGAIHSPVLLCGNTSCTLCIIYVFQRLDVQKETIELVHSNPTETRELPLRVPKDTPRYHFFLYKHSHEGDYLESVGMSLISWKSSAIHICFNMYTQARLGSHLYTWTADAQRCWERVQEYMPSSASMVPNCFA